MSVEPHFDLIPSKAGVKPRSSSIGKQFKEADQPRQLHKIAKAGSGYLVYIGVGRLAREVSRVKRIFP